MLATASSEHWLPQHLTFPFCVDTKLMAASVVCGIFLYANANVVADVTIFQLQQSLGY